MAIYRRRNRNGGFDYQVVVDYEQSATGARRRRIVGTFSTKREAEREERAAKLERDNGGEIPEAGLTVANLCRRFLTTVTPGLSGQTAGRYEEHLRMHVLPYIGHLEAAKLKLAHLSELYARLQTEKIHYVKEKRRADGTTYTKERDGKPLGSTTVLRVHRVIHRMLRWAVKNELITRNVASLFDKNDKPKATPSPARPLTREEVAEFLAAATSSPHYAFFEVAASTAMRRGEVGALMWDAISLEKGTVVVQQAIGQDRKGKRFIKPPKNEHTRTLQLNDQAKAALAEHRAKQRVRPLRGALVFPNEQGGLLDLDAVSKEFAAIARRIGIKARGISLHSFRHFGATEMLAAGVDVKTVARVLGHRDETMVLRVYGHVIGNAHDRAIAVIGDAIRDGQARRAGGQK